MTIINDGNFYENQITYLKETYGFKWATQTDGDKYFTYFEGLKDGESFKIRYNQKDKEFEVLLRNGWESL